MKINRTLDHAVLKPDMTPAEARDAILLGVQYDVYSVCVRPADIPLARDLTRGTNTLVGVVLSFPHGCGHSSVKAAEARAYIDFGVNEIDMVAHYGLIRAGEREAVRDDIASVSALTRDAGVLLKVILETSELELDQVRAATEDAIAAQADFVKTSTGFASGGATEEAVRAMLETAAGRIKVKPSGGIRDRARAEAFLAMGAHRLGVGSSSTPALCGDHPAADGGSTSAY